MRKLASILRKIDTFSDWTGKVLSMLLLLMVGMLMYEVILRYVFNNPTIWAHETSLFMYGGMGILLGAHTLRHRGHVNLDLFYRRFSPRRKAIIDSVTALLFFCYCAVFLYFSWKYGLKSLYIREFSITIWGPPIYPVKMVIPVAVTLITLQGLVKFIRDLFFAIRGRELL